MKKKESVSGAIVTIEDARKAIESIKKYLPKEPQPEGLLIPKKLWKKIKRHEKEN